MDSISFLDDRYRFKPGVPVGLIQDYEWRIILFDGETEMVKLVAKDHLVADDGNDASFMTWTGTVTSFLEVFDKV